MLWLSTWLAPNTMGERKVMMALTCSICSCGTEVVQRFPKRAHNLLCWDEARLAHSSRHLGKCCAHFASYEAAASCCCNGPISHLQHCNLLQRGGQNIWFLYIHLHFPVAFQFLCFFQAKLQLLTFLPTGVIYRLHPDSFPKHQLWQAGVCRGLFAMGLLLTMSCWPPCSAWLDQPSPSPT